MELEVIRLSSELLLFHHRLVIVHVPVKLLTEEYTLYKEVSLETSRAAVNVFFSFTYSPFSFFLSERYLTYMVNNNDDDNNSDNNNNNNNNNNDNNNNNCLFSLVRNVCVSHCFISFPTPM